MDLGKPLTVETMADREFAHRLNLPVPTHGGGWIISFQDHPDVVILDARLKAVLRLDRQAQSEDYCSTEVAISWAGSLFALSARTELRIADMGPSAASRTTHGRRSPAAAASSAHVGGFGTSAHMTM